MGKIATREAYGKAFDDDKLNDLLSIGEELIIPN